MDFIIKLLGLREPLLEATYNSILVVVDWLTKYAYFLLYREASTAEDLAYIFIRNVIG